MNRRNYYYDNDMSDDEYLYRKRIEEDSRNHYANVKKVETQLNSEDEDFLSFNDDEDEY
jgi:hypothetical protein